ncbi:MAG: Hpt domain-containing protein [Verrucomicrobiota bacterium]
MADFPGNIDWVAELIPNLAVKVEPFCVDTEEVDDELIEVFIDEIRRLSGELQDGVDQNDGEMVRIAAHSIKGMGGTMGLPEISVLGLEIENLAKMDQLNNTRPMIDALVRWMETIC